MSQYYAVEPEVAGRLGERTEMDSSTHPPAVERLHYVIDGWMGDDLLESFPCFVVSEALEAELTASELSGFELTDAEVKPSDQFEELHPDTDLPTFRRLEITGEAGKDDFGRGVDDRLVVSETALDVLERTNIDHADVEDYR